MKIFKHRGDIYVSKAGYTKSSRETQVLLTLLSVIVVVTIVFLIFLSQKYSSFSQFFAEGEISTSQNQSDNENEIILPQISGKTNYLILETDDDETLIHYAILIQSDKDNLAYKASALSPKTDINGSDISEIFNEGGGALLQSRLSEYFGFEIDYYAQFQTKNFVKFVNKLGNFVYTSPRDIRYDGGIDDDTYTLHINQGEQKIDAKQFSNLLRYYCNDELNLTAANEVILYGFSELFNYDNYENSQSLFKLFINSSSTNITVRDFEKGKDSLMVFCYKNSDVTIYSCVAEYEKTKLTQNSVQDIKGYFNK